MTRALHSCGADPLVRGRRPRRPGPGTDGRRGQRAPRGPAVRPTFLLCIALGLTPAALAKDSCIDCHSALADDLQKPALAFSKDVHSQHGFSCVDCHGGDRNADDPSGASAAT